MSPECLGANLTPIKCVGSVWQSAFKVVFCMYWSKAAQVWDGEKEVCEEGTSRFCGAWVFAAEGVC